MHSIKRVALVTSTLFLLAAATVVNGSQLYFMGSLLICLMGVSYVIARQSLGTIDVLREVPVSGWEGEVATFYLVVRSRSPLPKLMLQMRDHLPAWLDRDIDDDGYFDLPAAQEVRIPYSVLLRKRGCYHFDEVAIVAHDPLGFFTIARTWKVPAEITVFPVPQIVPAIGLSAADRYGSYEMPISLMHGSGIDPDGIRQYQSGDSLRRIHWKSLARTGTLNVVEFDEALMLHLVFVLDTTAGYDTERGPDSPFEYLVSMIASLADAAVRSGATFRLIAGETTQASVPGRGQAQLFTVLDALARVECNPDSAPPSAELYARVGPAGRGVSVIVFTAGTDPALPTTLAQYAAVGVNSIVVYADPRTFDTAIKSPSATTQRTFLDALLSSQVEVYRLARDDGRRLAPERIHGTRIPA